MRHAIYYTPESDHLLTQTAARWLGRDAFGNAVEPSGAIGDLSSEAIAACAVSARRYGFHATLKAPFTLAEGENEGSLDAALKTYAQTADTVELGALALTQIDGFFALVQTSESPQLQALAGDIVRTFDRFRAPLSDAEIARRNPERLSADELRNLTQWGYPYVFETFRFHMTLTDRVPERESRRLRNAIEASFGAVLLQPVTVDGAALFVEPEPGAPFVVKSYHRFGGA